MKKNRRNKIFILLLTVVLIGTLAGCNNDNKDNTGNGSGAYTGVDSNSGNETNTDLENENDAENNTNSDAENMTDAEADAGTTEGTEEETTEVVRPEYTFTEVSQTMYTTDVLNVRNYPDTDGEKIGKLSARQEIQVTGQCVETGWYRIKYNEGTGYVSDSYVTDKLPSSWVAELDAAQNTSQMIIVTAEGTDAVVSMHTKDENGVWNEEFETAGKIGRNGLGKEKEGDGKTPIGIFTFTDAFGIQSNPGITTMPYLQVDESYYWVDDPTSKYYNQFVTTKEVEPDWNSAEHICEYTKSYNYVLATNYNEERTPWVGCAIFLHCTNVNFGPTAGCIAIEDEYMIHVMRNLRSDCIIIIDTPTGIYNY